MQPNLQFSIPSDLTFEQAIGLAEEILALPPESDVLETALSALLQTTNGGRGFFVTFLSGESPLADAPSEGLLRALRSAPNVVADLMTKNLAMSTAMELHHQRNQDLDNAAGSARVKQRSGHLIQLLQLPELTTQLQQLLDSTTHPGGEYQGFLERWGYDPTQIQAIRDQVQSILIESTSA